MAIIRFKLWRCHDWTVKYVRIEKAGCNHKERMPTSVSKTIDTTA